MAVGGTRKTAAFGCGLGSPDSTSMGYHSSTTLRGSSVECRTKYHHHWRIPAPVSVSVLIYEGKILTLIETVGGLGTGM